MWAIYNPDDIRVSDFFEYPDDANAALAGYPLFYYVAWAV